MKFLSDIRVEEGLRDKDGGLGSPGQVLSSTGSLTSWIDASGTIGGSIADNEIAVEASTANTIEGSEDFSLIPLTLSGGVTSARLRVRGRLEMSDNLLSGTANLYIGSGAGSTSSQGSNTGVGNGALGDQISGVSSQGAKNCALGLSALTNLTLGSGNIGIGYQSLFWLTGTGQNDNTVIGTNAARYYSTGTDQLTQSSQGVYIGSDTRASANNISNEIAMGYGVVGGGSNTITLGNSSIDTFRIPGLGNTNGHVLTYSTADDGFILAAGGGGGGGTIGGTIAITELAVGDATDSIDGSSKLTFTYVSGGAGYDKLRIGDGSTGSNQVLLDINTLGTGSSRGRLTLSDAGTFRGYLGITGGDEEVTLLSNDNLILDCNGDGNGGDVIIATQSVSDVGIGTTTPQSKLQVNGGIQMGTDGAAANLSAKAGTLRYREDEVAGAGNSNSYVQMYMRTGTSTYDWTTIIRNNW